MGFNFDPKLWFVCSLCRNSFASTEILKEHKLACHLGECLQIKCIIFEERLLTEEWNYVEDENRTWNANGKNPCVSLTRMTAEEKKSLNQGSSSHEHQRRKSPRRKGLLQSPFRANRESELSKHKLGQTDHGDGDYDAASKVLNCDFHDSQSFSSKESMHSEQEIQVKEESATDDLSIPISSTADEAAFINSEDVKVEEFMDASVSLNCDEISRVQFASTSIPTSQEYQLYQQQHQMNSDEATSSNADTGTTFAPSEHQESVYNNEAIDFNTILTKLRIKVDAYDSDLPNPTLEEIQEPEQELNESIQPQQSTSLSNRQSTTATDANIEKPFMCETCFASFRTKDKLNSHMVSHSSFKPYKCSKCPSKFKRKENLTRHQIVHGMETKFKCRFCNKCFIHNQNLLHHELSHTGDRPFKCPVAGCDYAASRKYVLAQHARARHSEELGLQQFICLTCGKTYGIRSRLDEHVRILHSDATPFRCTHKRCTKKFKSKQHLKRHLKVHL